MPMPIQEYLNNAELIRLYTPVVTSPMTIGNNFSFGKWFVIGQMVIVDLNINFTTSVTPAAYVDVSLPVKAGTGGRFALYSGAVNTLGAQVSGWTDVVAVGAVGAASTIRIRRYDNANWTLGSALVVGTAMYEKEKTA